MQHKRLHHINAAGRRLAAKGRVSQVIGRPAIFPVKMLVP
jgi:hypothetical protein